MGTELRPGFSMRPVRFPLTRVIEENIVRFDIQGPPSGSQSVRLQQQVPPLERRVEEMNDPMTFNERFENRFDAEIHTAFFNWIEAELGGEAEFYDEPFERMRLAAIGHGLEKILNHSVKLLMEDVDFFTKAETRATAADSSDVALLMAKVNDLEVANRRHQQDLEKMERTIIRQEAKNATGGQPIDLGGGFMVDPETYDKMKNPHKYR